MSSLVIYISQFITSSAHSKANSVKMENKSQSEIVDVSLDMLEESDSSSKGDYAIMSDKSSQEDQAWKKKEFQLDFGLKTTKKDTQIKLVDSDDSDKDSENEVEPVMLHIESSEDDEEVPDQPKELVKVVDYSSFPAIFKSQEKALERYNELGIHHNLLFMCKSTKSSRNKFELKWYMKDCEVSVKFSYDEDSKLYRRIEGYNMTHTHFWEPPELPTFDPLISEEFHRIFLEDPIVSSSDFAVKISNVLNREVHAFESFLILLTIRRKYKVDYSMLALDCQSIQQRDSQVYIVLNKGDLTVMLLQTKLMAEHLQHNPYSILISVSDTRMNKYGFYTIIFTSITILGQAVTCGFGFVNIKCIEAFSWVFAKFLERSAELSRRRYSSSPQYFWEC